MKINSYNITKHRFGPAGASGETIYRNHGPTSQK